MKKILGLILAFCLVLAVAAGAFAAKLSITKQPENGTTNKRGTVKFAIKINGDVNSITWHFIDPATGNDYTGRKLSSAVKGVKVSNPNSKVITLKNVPESMHGWIVYCHINGNGYKIDSEKVRLLINGLEPPAESPETEASSGKEKDSGSKSGKDSKNDKNSKPAEEAKTEEETKAGSEGDGEGEGSGESAESEEPEVKSITVSCNVKALRKLDRSGAVETGEPVSNLDFGDANSGSFIVTSEDPIKSYTVNGVQIEPTEPVKEFRILNVTSSLTLRLKVNRATAASAQVDESHMCKVTCKGCTFSYLRGGIRAVAEGDVPAGAPISIVADSAELSALGYSINGAEPVSLGMASIKITVTDDITITCGN